MAEEILEDVNTSDEGITPSYSNAFLTMWTGFVELLVCLKNSFVKNSREIAIGALHHWLFSIILIGMFANTFVSLLNARTERDEACKKSYILQQQNDSIKTIMMK